MPRGFRIITPAPGLQWVNRFGVTFFYLFALLTLIAGLSTSGIINWSGQVIFFVILGTLNAVQLGHRLAVSDEVLFVGRGGFSRRFIRWSWIDSFAWRHDVERVDARQRLWVILDDGQAYPTPVVISSGSLTSNDVCLTADQARTLEEELEGHLPARKSSP